jgi:two-component system CheB/CheR fusion protein
VRLAQVVSNLLGNASKYTDPGGAIEVEVQRRGEFIEVAVRDTGCGISPEALPKVFDLFVQEDRSLSRSQGGLGIGLAVVKSMVELHGGTVSAASAGAGQGSEFALRLPRIACPDALATTSETQRRRCVGPPHRVLLADDNVDFNDALAAVLRLCGHEVSTVNDGIAAIERIAVDRPDVVVCDIGLPGMDGYGVARHVKSNVGEPQPTLIAVTGYGQPEDRERALAAGFDHHLVKPVDVDVLCEMIDVSRPHPEV